ncbi:hypothetical protein OFB58_24635, partial [Escherichia coli]|nr:hypothetical protein [Escherichia coli]
MSIKNDGHYFCRAGGNRPDGLNEPVTNEHMDGMFQRFSKLLPFRIDFAYKKGTPSFGYSCKHSLCMEIYRLHSE